MGSSRSRHLTWESLGFDDEARTEPTMAWYHLGDDEADDSRPTVMKVRFPPSHRVEPHLHRVDYTELVLEGAQQVGRTWYRPGDVRVSTAGTPYGPLVAGPDGATVLIIFRGTDWRSTYVGPNSAAAEAAAEAVRQRVARSSSP